MDAFPGLAGSAPVLPFDISASTSASSGTGASEGDRFAGTIEELIRLLKDQHDDISALFSTYDSLGRMASVTRRLVAEELLSALERHVKVEVRHFLPLYRSVDEHRALLAAEHLALLRGVVRTVQRTLRAGKPIETKMALLRDMYMAHRTEQDDHEFLAVRNMLERQRASSNLLRFRVRKNSIQLC